MSYRYLENMELEEALKIYLDGIAQKAAVLPSEEVPVVKSLGRITSEAVFAGISSPHYNACAMDGIAVFAQKTFGATDTTPVFLREDTDFVRVDTGDPLPQMFDAVIMIEDVIEQSNGEIKLITPAIPWQHVRQIGEDICAGEMILTSNIIIQPASIGAMLAGGVQTVKVIKRPVVGIIPTGDEIVAPTGNPKTGEIIEFNTSIFSGMLTGWGAEARTYGIVPDDRELIEKSLSLAVQECDVVVLIAGSSAGRGDFSSEIIGRLGTVLVHGIAIKPGKPAILGIVRDKPVIGLPGYPVSGIIVMEKIVKRVLEQLNRLSLSGLGEVSAVLTRKLVSTLKYKEFIRVKLGNIGGQLAATPLNRGAGVITSFVKADGIMEIPLDSEGFEAGRRVNIQLLKNIVEIDNTLVVNGSHDPLIDVAADIMRRRHPDEYLSSAHVGSMGGIMAIKRGETHLAGIHLLDEDTGCYNRTYIKKYLSGKRIIQIGCVKRMQGLMVAKGNPKGIKGLEELDNTGLSYVNRQKGSGTRILLDYLLKCKGIASGGIYGYEREEFTHMAVAALIASGSSDAGMGIYSAAKVYGLDFLPVCEEQYDFILPLEFMELGIVKHFIEILKSYEFGSIIEAMGGYRLENTGCCEEIV